VITGGTGFLGSHLTNELRGAGADNLVIVNSKVADLRLTEACARIVKDADVVFHLAAKVGGIGYNLAYPGELFYDNIMMGVNMMHESMLAGVKKFVTVATVCGYPKLAPIPFEEDKMWDGYPEESNAPYGLAKKMLLVMSGAYRSEYRFNSIVLFPANLYGPGDSFDPKRSHVIPALVKKFWDAKSEGRNAVEVWGDGKASRDFLYVEDAAYGLRLAAEHYGKSEPVNLGSGVEVTIGELVEQISDIVEFRGDVKWDTTKPSGQPRRRLDTARAEKEFGFRARTPLRAGLERTIKWFQSQVNPKAKVSANTAYRGNASEH
jgi:GDP-L-fucose synthase